jgi:hypothetical protein
VADGLPFLFFAAINFRSGIFNGVGWAASTTLMVESMATMPTISEDD